MFRRNTLVTLIFVVSLFTPVFAQETEEESVAFSDFQPRKWGEIGIAFGFELGGFWESSFEDTNKVKTEMSSTAYHIRSYRIRSGKDVGFFVHGFLSFPRVNALNGTAPMIIDYYGRQIGASVGILFKHTHNKKFSLFYGVGPNVSFARERYAQYAILTSKKEDFNRNALNFGVSVDCELQYAIDNVVFSFGAIANYDFLSYAALKASSAALNTSGRVSKFSTFGVRPYVSMGFRR